MPDDVGERRENLWSKVFLNEKPEASITEEEIG